MKISPRVEAFDGWIRSAFVDLNTELEELYFAQDDRAQVEGVGDDIKGAVARRRPRLCRRSARGGNTGDGFESGFAVLGNVGLYMGALRRHELTNPDREEKIAVPGGVIAGASCGRFDRHGAALCHRPSRHA